MTRRSFRLGLRLGLLAGVLIVVAKLVQSRRSSRDDAWPTDGSGAATWPPLQADPVAPEPPVVTLPDRIAPVTKAPANPQAPTAPATGAGAGAGALAATPGETAAAAVPPMTPSTQPAARARAAKVPKAAKAAKVTKAAKAPRPARAAASRAAPAAAPVTRRVRKAGTRRVAARTAWMEPAGGECPPSHPVKAKLSSMLYHLPGMAAYNRTHPDRCYTDATAAETDGFIRAKR